MSKICHVCGNKMIHKTGTLDFEINGQQRSVQAVVHFQCPVCEEIVIEANEIARIESIIKTA